MKREKNQDKFKKYFSSWSSQKDIDFKFAQVRQKSSLFSCITKFVPCFLMWGEINEEKSVTKITSSNSISIKTPSTYIEKKVLPFDDDDIKKVKNYFIKITEFKKHSVYDKNINNKKVFKQIFVHEFLKIVSIDEEKNLYKIQWVNENLFLFIWSL